jgi:hypothetical protein
VRTFTTKIKRSWRVGHDGGGKGAESLDWFGSYAFVARQGILDVAVGLLIESTPSAHGKVAADTSSSGLVQFAIEVSLQGSGDLHAGCSVSPSPQVRTDVSHPHDQCFPRSG